MSICVTYDSNMNMTCIEHDYGGEGWDKVPTKSKENENCHIEISFKDGKIYYCVLWSYWRSMFFDTVMEGNIEYKEWEIPEMIERIKTLAERFASERRSWEDYGPSHVFDNIHKDGIQTVINNDRIE